MNNANSHDAEFNSLMIELMGRDDIQDRNDICSHIFDHANELLAKPTKETLQRAYDLMGNLASQFGYVPAMAMGGMR